MKMKQTNIIGDTYKDRSIDYDLIDSINRQFERKGRKEELKTKLAKKKKRNEKKAKRGQETDKPIPSGNIIYIQTPNELKNITRNYSLQKGIYEIDFDIYVPHYCELILEPGVQFLFTKNAGITCEGRFEARGGNGLEVLLTAKDKDDGWKNLYLRSGAEAIINYAKFSYGKGRLDKEKYLCGGAVFLEEEDSLNPSITINNSCFENNSARWGGAIACYKGNVTIGEKNRFENNFAQVDAGAIYIRLGRLYMDISKNTFIGNKPNNIYDG